MSEPLKNLFGNIRIVLCETRHPGNIGAAARAMKTMGLSRLFLVNPERFPDREAEGRATNAGEVLAQAQVCASLGEALQGVALAVACSARSRDIAVPETDARSAATQLVEVAQTQQVALVFGNETRGLTTEQVNLCRLMATIPANPEHSSLNLAAAVQVFCYELRMCAGGGALSGGERNRARELASHEELEGFYVHLESELVQTGFLNPDQPKKLMYRLRRMFARANLEHEEVNILRGVVRTLREPKKRD